MKITLTVLVVWLMGSLTGFAQSATYSKAVLAKIRQVEQHLAANVRTPGDKDWTLQERLAYYRIPGISVAVIHNYQVEWTKAYGFTDVAQRKSATSETRFQAGPLSQALNGVGMLTLVQDKKIDLYADINQYLTTWKFPYDSVTNGKKITTANLLSHTAGLPPIRFSGYAVNAVLPTIAQILDGQGPANSPAVRSRFAPGLGSLYSGGGLVITQQLLRDVTHQPYDQYMQERVLKPMGMTNSYYGDNAKLIKNRASGYQTGKNGGENADYMSMTLPYAAGSIQSTVADLWKWHQAVHNYKLVKKESLDKAFTRYKLNDGKPTGYGYGWSLGTLQGSPTIEHGGGINGFLTEGIYLPQEDVFVAVFSNSTGQSPNFVASKIAAAAIGKPYTYTEIPMETSALQAYTGVYEGEDGEQRVLTAIDGKLYSQRTGGRKGRLKPYGKDKFYFDGDLSDLQFVRNSSGQVEQAHYQSRQGSLTWKKTDKPLPPARQSISVREAVLDSYIGDYQIGPNFILTITREQNRLISQATGQGKAPLLAETETKFYPEVFEAQIEFMKDDSGKVTKLLLQQGGRSTEAKKIK